KFPPDFQTLTNRASLFLRNCYNPPQTFQQENRWAMKKPHSASPSKRQYWLFKSEPESFSIDDLARQKKQSTFWDGVRNYQARNFLRDSIQLGDGVLFYHSSTEPMAIVGSAEVTKTGYPDHTAYEPTNHHYDPKSDPDNPTWYMVDIRLLQTFPHPLTRA